ncbi:MAG: multidrug transporter ATP-binding protein [Hyphomicrobiales bacterium]|nr:multidrug transporter ATP-binding protein [Hyphomicrobiales bacterium]
MTSTLAPIRPQDLATDDDTASPPLFEARGLTVQAGPVQVLRDVNLSLRRGRVLGLIGESGAGKSMLGRVIADQLPDGFRVAAGSLRFGATDLLALSKRKHRSLLGREIAFIPQEPMMALNPAMTIGNHFREHLRRLGFSAGVGRKAALAALADVRIEAPETVYDQYCFQLSGGMCQRVLIALAFISNPDLVIADEPTASLDVTTQGHIVSLLRAMQKRHGTAVLFITHQLRLAAQICDQVAVLYAGEVVEEGPARELFLHARHPYTCALHASMPNFDGEWRALASPSGQMPGLPEYPILTGCRFAPRCASAIDACLAAPPLLADCGDGTALRCIRPGAVAKNVEADPPSLSKQVSAAALLKVDNVTKIFRRGGWLSRTPGQAAVSSASFSVAPGEFVGVVGESGSGKSTLGRLIMGLEEPSAGRILLDDKPLGGDEAEWRRRIASIQFVFQDPRAALNPRRSTLQLVTQPLQPGDVSRQQRRARAEQMLRATGLPLDTLTKISSEMSGGQRQRVNIARALCNTPRLLIADEITSGLDVSVQAQILNLLLRLRSEFDIALLMISHDLAVVRYLCSRVLVMWKGVIVESGETEAVFSTPQHPYTRELIAALPPEDISKRWAPLATL